MMRPRAGDNQGVRHWNRAVKSWRNRGLSVKSLGVRLCPVCQLPGRLKADLRRKNIRFYVSHNAPKTPGKYSIYGKYLNACYIGLIAPQETDLIIRMDANA